MFVTALSTRNTFCAASCLLAALACGGSESTGPSAGSIQVATATTGDDLDRDGYTVAVDGGPGQALAANGMITYSELSAGNHTVALKSTRDGVTEQIYTVNVVGTGLMKLTSFSSGAAEGARWSPDGRSIAFYDYFGGIYVMNEDGSNIHELTADGSAPAWSPDGKRVAFVTDRDGSSEVYVMNSDGSAATRLTYNGAIHRESLDWSPDGQRIAFASSRDNFFEIYTMSEDGSGAQ